MFTSLRIKIIVLVMIPMLLCLGFFSYLAISRGRSAMERLTMDSMDLLASIVMGSLTHEMEEGKSEDVQKMLEKMEKEKGILNIRIFDKKGKILRSLVQNEIGGMVKPNYVEAFDRGERWLISKDERMYTRIEPIWNQETCYRCHSSEKKINGILDIDFTPQRFFKESKNTQRFLLLISFFTISGLFLGVWFIFSFFVNKPITTLVAKMMKVGEGDLTVRAEQRTKDEIGKLGRSFNLMLDRLQATRKELQQCNIERMERVERLASIGQVAAGLAHEIKNPLAGISGAIDVIADEVALDDPKKEVFSEIKIQIERIRKTLTDLLMFARPSQPERKHTNINALIRDTLFLVQQQKEIERITFEKELSRNLPDLYLDPNQIQQILLNILLNAIQAMPEGGTLKAKTSISPDKKYCEVEVSDTGVGISSEQLSHIFEPFYTTKHQGTGLGLSIAKRIIEEHGGEVSVESASGKGTIFRILLPIQKKVA